MLSIPDPVRPGEMGYNLFAFPWLNAMDFQGIYKVTAKVSFKEFQQGTGIKILSLYLGRSPLSISACTTLLKRCLPGISLTKDGYILLKPMEIVNYKDGKKLYEIKTVSIQDKKLRLEIR